MGHQPSRGCVEYKPQPLPMKSLIQHNIDVAKSKKERRKEEFAEKVNQLRQFFGNKDWPYPIVPNKYRMVLHADYDGVMKLEDFFRELRDEHLECQQCYTSADNQRLMIQMQMSDENDVQMVMMIFMSSYAKSFSLTQELNHKHHY